MTFFFYRVDVRRSRIEEQGLMGDDRNDSLEYGLGIDRVIHPKPFS